MHRDQSATAAPPCDGTGLTWLAGWGKRVCISVRQCDRRENRSQTNSPTDCTSSMVGATSRVRTNFSPPATTKRSQFRKAGVKVATWSFGNALGSSRNGVGLNPGPPDSSHVRLFVGFMFSSAERRTSTGCQRPITSPSCRAPSASLTCARRARPGPTARRKTSRPADLSPPGSAP